MSDERGGKWRSLLPGVVLLLALAIVPLALLMADDARRSDSDEERTTEVVGVPELVVEVLESDNVPVPGARVLVVPEGGGDLVADVLTDADGRVQIDVAPGRYGVVASMGDRAAHAIRVHAPCTVLLRLARGIPIRARVRGTDGAPLEGVAVTARIPYSGELPRDTVCLPDETRDHRWLFRSALAPTLRTDAHGIADFGALPRGADGSSLQFVVDVEPWVPELVDIDGESDAAIDLVMKRSVDVRGRVVDAAQEPVYYVEVRDVATGRKRVVDRDGRFVLPLISADGGTLVFVPGAFGARRTPVVPLFIDRPRTGDTEQDLGDCVLPEGRRLRGVVRWPDGAPAAGARVTARLRDLRWATLWGVTVDADGRFETPRLPDATYVVEAFGVRDGPVEGSPYADAGDVKATPDAELRLVLDRAVPELRVHVRDASGDRPSGGLATLERHWWLDVTVELEHGEGRLPLRGEPPWKVEIRVAGFETQQVTVVEQGLVKDLTVTLRREEP